MAFEKIFSRVYHDYVDNEQTDNKKLVEKIQQLGQQFTINVFKGVNDFINAVFETTLALYDPDILGFLEDLERDLDKMVLTKTVQNQTYFVLLVLSRVINKDKDKDLRFKCLALANVSPQDFGTDEYLLLNEQAPLMKIVENENSEFDEMVTKLVS